MRAEYIDRIKIMGNNGGYWESPVLDVGGQTAQYQHNQSYDMRKIFSDWNIEYVNLDIEPGDGIDIVDDAQEMVKVPSNNFGSILCLGMLEHCENPFKVITQCHRVLKPGGVIMVSVPFEYPVHSPHDFWRFTDQGVELLMKDFEKLELRELGNYSTRNHEVYFIGRKKSA